MEELRYLDSSGVRALLYLYNTTTKQKIHFSICNLKDRFIILSLLPLLFLTGCPLFRYESKSIDPFLVNLEQINTEYNDYNAYAPTAIFDEFGIVYSTDFPSSGENLDLWTAEIHLKQTGSEVEVDGSRTGAFSSLFNSDADERGPILTGPHCFDYYQEEGSTSFYPQYFEPESPAAEDIFFLFSRDKSGEDRGFDILFSRFLPEQEVWGEIKPAGFNSIHNDYYPCCDDEYIYFSSDRSGNDDIYRIRYAETGEHRYIDEEALLAEGDPVPVDELNTAADDSCPYVYTDWATGEKIMVFSSDREGGAGSYDIYYSLRDDETGTWQAPVRLGGLVNSLHNEYRPTIYSAFTMEPFKYILLFSSDRPGGNGGYDLYVAGSESISF